MPKKAHDEAAQRVAELYGKGDYDAGKKHSATAHEHSGKARKASKNAHNKSQSQK